MSVHIKKQLLGISTFIGRGYLRKWLVIAILIGIVAGVGSIIFYMAINWATWLFLEKGAGFIPPSPAGEGATVVSDIARRWMIPVVCTVGGLISGWIVFKFAPEAEGHGTDAAINAFHNKEGFIRRRIAPIKLLASAITIGSGGSAGREGPVALIGAGFGSTIADIFRLNSHDRRIALAVGIGAGIGAIFKAPLGGALISTEILYKRDFEFEALLPSFISSIVGYSIFASWHGWDPIFNINSTFAFNKPQELLGYAILGLVCGLFGILYGRSFYRIRDRFKAWNVPRWIKPAAGGLAVGVIGMFLPQILGMGYGWVQLAINNDTAALPLGIIIAVIFAKIVATGLSVGSGGSGGVFAPGLVIGGMVGGATWTLLRGAGGIVPADPGPFIVLGMMTLFGGIAKAPLAIMIMVSEMTGNYNLLIPSMVSVVIAYVVSEKSFIYEKQVNTRADSPAHRSEYGVPLLHKIRVVDTMTTRPLTMSSGLDLADLMAWMNAHKIEAVPVVDSGVLTGIITTRDIAKVHEDKWPQTLIRDVMTRKLILGHPDETLYSAFHKMTEHKISHLPIVERGEPEKLVGLLALSNVTSCYDSVLLK
ncbi:chloride channel protein, CIC family [Dehalogenimonas formicexedens]|uniref:Chloride channel protein, CIC family n=1 Tax=Dehalogenimonas formicexedens TaxID=1839801 RepID=A0A1P8F8J3_9CHLR|nr:chloride channel protein [Dehalogenimonas formicexedens]APV44799.1 chloride channel protein, CIC family [Dehalogenimonas formicexedens]